MSSKNSKQSAYPIFAKKFNETIGYKGKSDRKSRSIAAGILEVKYENIRVWSEGIYLPKGDMLLKIKEKYGVNVDWLLTGEEHAAKTPEKPPDHDLIMKHLVEVVEENGRLKEKLKQCEEELKIAEAKRVAGGEK